MKKYKIIVSTLLVLVAAACQETDRTFQEFDDLEHGAIARLIVPVAGNLSLNPGDPSVFANSTLTWTVEFYDDNKGKNVESYVWTVAHPDAPTPTVIVSRVKADFVTSVNGLPSTAISITGADILTTLGLTNADLTGGDTFSFRATMTLSNGKVYTATNTADNLEAQPAFASFFQFNKAVVCPSDLAGTYDADTDWIDYYGVPGSNSYTETLTAIAGFVGRYSMLDLSGGMEPIVWSNPAVACQIDDVCNEIRLFSAPYSYQYFIDGDANTLGSGSVVDTGTGVITIYWENLYAEHGVTVLTPQ